MLKIDYDSYDDTKEVSEVAKLGVNRNKYGPIRVFLSILHNFLFPVPWDTMNDPENYSYRGRISFWWSRRSNIF